MGILAAQSTGEATTQLSLNSFHSVGYGNSTLSQGVPRLKTLIDASRPKYPVHILKTRYNNVEELDNVVGTSIREVKLRHLVRLVNVTDNTCPGPEWHKNGKKKMVIFLTKSTNLLL